MARCIPLFYRESMGAGEIARPVSKAPRPGEVAADGQTAPCSRPSAAAALADLAGARDRIARSLEHEFPHWRIWHRGRWMARRRDAAAPADPGPAFISRPGLHEFRVLLAIEDGREPRGAWKK